MTCIVCNENRYYSDSRACCEVRASCLVCGREGDAVIPCCEGRDPIRFDSDLHPYIFDRRVTRKQVENFCQTSGHAYTESSWLPMGERVTFVSVVDIENGDYQIGYFREVYGDPDVFDFTFRPLADYRHAKRCEKTQRPVIVPNPEVHDPHYYVGSRYGRCHPDTRAVLSGRSQVPAHRRRRYVG